MSFLIDAQLPPSLAEALRGVGLQAIILRTRFGNIDNRTLIARILRSLARIMEALERGETVIELVGR